MLPYLRKVAGMRRIKSRHGEGCAFEKHSRFVIKMNVTYHPAHQGCKSDTCSHKKSKYIMQVRCACAYVCVRLCFCMYVRVCVCACVCVCVYVGSSPVGDSLDAIGANDLGFSAKGVYVVRYALNNPSFTSLSGACPPHNHSLLAP